MIRVCAWCGGEFNPRGPQKNCSKACMEKSSKSNRAEYREKNRAHKLKVDAEYRRNNREKIKSGQKRAVEANKEHYAKYKREWYLLNKDRTSATAKEKRRETFVAKVKICIICGCEYNTVDRRGSAKTCSNECGEELNLPRRVYYDIKKTMGLEPPPDLVEEATALRLLNRALREAT